MLPESGDIPHIAFPMNENLVVSTGRKVPVPQVEGKILAAYNEQMKGMEKYGDLSEVYFWT